MISPLFVIPFMDKCIGNIGVGRYHVETLPYADDVAAAVDSTTDLH